MADDRFDFLELLVKIASAFGANPVRVRWKLMRLREDLARWRVRAGRKAQHIAYEHKTCHSCGRVVDRDERTCPGCGAALSSRSMQVLQRVGLAIPDFVSASTLLTAAMIAAYARMGLASGSWMSLDVRTLAEAGANWPPLILQGGEWWRLGTAAFLHASLMHIGFNLIALMQIGPAIEHLHGRGTMVFLFMLTAAIANVLSISFGLSAVQVGASGGLMGLTGVAAGWGQRDGTSAGRAIRNMMLQWAAYTLLFGFFVHADNVAHLGGFVSGAVLGWVIRPKLRGNASWRPLTLVAGLCGIAAAVACTVLVLFPPKPGSMLSEKREHALDAPPDAATLARFKEGWRDVAEACRTLSPDAGRSESAQVLEKLRERMVEGAPRRVDAETCARLEGYRDDCREWESGGMEQLPQGSTVWMEALCGALLPGAEGPR